MYKIEAIKENKKYRLVSGMGQYMNTRFEIQERYKYYESDKWVYSWHLIYHSSDIENCIKVWNENYNTID
jgi:hypothetical protein